MTFQRDKFRQLIELLESLPDERVDMASWANTTSLSQAPECNTAACAGGWATTLFPGEIELYWDAPCVWIRSRKTGAGDIVAMSEVFGLKKDEVVFLFCDHNARHRNRTQQITVMRQYLAAHQEAV